MLLKRVIDIRIVVCVLFFVTLSQFAQSVAAQSTISGFVYDKQRNHLVEVDVELLNENYQARGRAKTDGSGRYSFEGLTDGRYTVKVMPFRYELEDQEFMIEINTLNIRGGAGVGYYTQDFYLSPKKGGLADAELSVVFAQEVPPEAKKLFKSAVDNLSDKRVENGILGLNDAIKIFPDYYDALHRIGKELYILKGYKDAVPYLIKASEINPKSATTFYYLGASLNHLGSEYNRAAIASLNQAVLLAPASAQANYLLGKVEREERNFVAAEKHLLKAKTLSKVSVPEIHRELAQLYANDLKKYMEAANELESYLKASRFDGKESDAIKKKIADLKAKAKGQTAKS